MAASPEVVALSLDVHVGNLFARIKRLTAERDARERRAAEAVALDLGAIEALAQKVVSDDEGGSDVGWRALELARDHVPALVKRVRELEAQIASSVPSAAPSAAGE